MLHVNDRRGFTLLETVTVSGLMMLVVISIVSMTIGSLRCYDGASNRTYTDMDAVMAMQMIVNELREAKRVEVLDSGPTIGARLRVFLPTQATGQDYYDRHNEDTSHYIDYYLSDSTGQIGRTGTWLWRAQNGGLRIRKQDIQSIQFEVDTLRSVKITIDAFNSDRSGGKTTELTQRVVYLRNY